MRYYHIQYSNGYCGCDMDDEEDIQSYQYRIYENSYYEEISETEYLKHKGE